MLLVEYSIPVYLTEKKNIVRHIFFTALFALIFINLYAPFDVENWVKLTKLQLVFSSSLVILTGVLVIAISRIIMYQVCRWKKLNYFRYGLWIAGEIISMGLVYAILLVVILKDKRDFTIVFKSTLVTTLLVLLIPYTITWLYFSWMDKNSKLEKMTGTPVPKASLPMMLAFNDEKGDLRFSLKTQDLLYLEAADNYVVIHYSNNNKPARYIIRNSLKSMEAGLHEAGIIRCHRSYMVNFERVKIIKKERDGLMIELDEAEKHPIPVSKTYVDQVMKIFSAYSAIE